METNNWFAGSVPANNVSYIANAGPDVNLLAKLATSFGSDVRLAEKAKAWATITAAILEAGVAERQDELSYLVIPVLLLDANIQLRSR